MEKRLFDIVLSSFGLLVFSPVIFLFAVLIIIDSKGSVFYRGERVGKGEKIFRIYKFRTMVQNAELIGASSTADDDPRITKFGKFLRRFKLDELPQIINIFKGEMSFVGPRPQVKWATDLYNKEEKIILTVRPGLTDLAFVEMASEGEILQGSKDPDKDYMEKIHPQKVQLQMEYVRKRSFAMDMKIMIKTALVILK